MSLRKSIRSLLWGPSPENPANALRPWRWWGASPTQSGTPVNEHTALCMVSVYAAVRLIAETVASLPLFVYRRRDDGGRDVLRDHPVTRLLHDQPNELMSAAVFRETLLASVLLWGNGFAAIVRDQAGRIVELWPMRPEWTEIRKRGMDLEYRYTPNDAEAPQTIVFRPEEVLHVPGLAFDGVRGLSPIALAREAVGLGLSAETFGARFFGAGTHPSGVVEVPEHLTDQNRQVMRENLERAHTGLGNSHRTMILENGSSWKSIGVPPEDAQFIETRKFQNNEIARLYRISPTLLSSMESATYNNVENLFIQFSTLTLRPWLVRLEQEYRRKLLSQTTLFCEHTVEGLLRGNLQARYAAYATARQWGWMSVNDIRQLENLNPIGDEGDIYLTPLNMTPSDYVDPMAEAELEKAESGADMAGRMPMMAPTTNGTGEEPTDE